uniref:RNA-directed DNA polymerase n=1 Tax=Strongyloides venezuelensis TaxID=75913 RepID=A0A0K0F419_STRVS
MSYIHLPEWKKNSEINITPWLRRFKTVLELDDITDPVKQVKAVATKLPDCDSEEVLDKIVSKEIVNFDQLTKLLETKYSGKQFENAARLKLKGFEIDITKLETGLKELTNLVSQTYPTSKGDELFQKQTERIENKLESNVEEAMADIVAYNQSWVNKKKRINDKRPAGKRLMSKSEGKLMDKSKIQCYECQEVEHYRNECQKIKKEDQKTTSQRRARRLQTESFKNEAKVPETHVLDTQKIWWKTNDDNEDEKVTRKECNVEEIVKSKNDEPEICEDDIIKRKATDRNHYEFIIPVSFKDKELTKALIDTGATQSSMKLSQAKKVGFNEAKAGYCTLANGSQWKNEGSIRTLMRLPNNVEMNAEFTVVKDEKLDAGQFILDYHNGVIQCAGRIIEVIENGTMLNIKKKIRMTEIQRFVNDSNWEERLENLLDKYDEIFSKKSTDIGKCIIKAPKNILENYEQLKIPRIPIPQHQKLIYQNQIREWIQADVIEKCYKPQWIINLLLTPKQDGNYRCCLDCRPLNKAIRNFDFRMPVIRDKAELLSNAKYYSVIDLIQYFNQIELQDDDKQLFDFRDSEGIPAIAQAVINQILEECLKFCFSYIDDIIIMSKNSLEEHYGHIEKVLQALKKANLKVNKRKSVFGAIQVNFLGFTFSQNGMVPNNYALETLDRMSPPQSLKSLRRRNKEYNWNVECQKNYDDVKLLLKNACRLSLQDFSLPFQLYTDASGDCFGSALMQKRKNKDGKETMVPLGFYSRRNPLRVTFQPAVKLELQCICESMKHFHQWVAGGFTIIHTDHLPLVKLVKKNSNPNMFRYVENLLSYSFEIKYIQGERNVVADCISRMYLRRTTEEKGKDNSKRRSETLPKDNVVFRNKKKSRVKKMPTMEKLEKDVNVQKIVLDDKNVESLEMKKNEPTEDEKLKLFQQFHDNLGHGSIERIYHVIKIRKNWKTLRKDLKSYLTRCQTCLKRNQTYKTCDVEKLVYASRPWEVVNIDVLGSLQVDEYGMKHIVEIIDLNAKYLTLESVPDCTTNEILEALERSLFFKYGAPERIRIDNAPYLKADVMKTITKEYGSVMDYGTPYLHTSSTHIERAFRTIENQLSKEANGSYTGWSKLVPQVAFHYNSRLTAEAIHEETRGEPVEPRDDILFEIGTPVLIKDQLAKDKFAIKYTPGYVITGCKGNSFFIKKTHLRGRPKLVHRDHIKVDTSILKEDEKVKVGRVNSV